MYCLLHRNSYTISLKGMQTLIILKLVLRYEVKGYLHGDAGALSPCCREKMRQTYEFAVDHVGIDFHSGSVWLEFITFLKEE